jgi:hypothetical protein
VSLVLGLYFNTREDGRPRVASCPTRCHGHDGSPSVVVRPTGPRIEPPVGGCAQVAASGSRGPAAADGLVPVVASVVAPFEGAVVPRPATATASRAATPPRPSAPYVRGLASQSVW